jgi:competence protein ComEA
MTRRLVAGVGALLAVSLAVSLPAFAAETAPHSATKEHAKHAMMHRTDLNAAGEKELMALPGIDQATAQKIIADRPYTKAEDLVTKGIVTKEAFAKIHGHVMAHAPSAAAHHTMDHAGNAHANHGGSSEGETH